MNLEKNESFYLNNNLVEEWRYYFEDDWEKGYEIALSSKGRVMNFVRNKKGVILKGSHINGYKVINTRLKSGKRQNFYVHKLMALAFFEKPEDGLFVIHKNHEKTDNNLQNLAWVSRKQWEKHQDKNPKVIAKRKSKKRTYTKLSFAEATILKRKLLDPNRRTRLKVLAKQFGVSEMQLHRIKTGENWGDLKV
ncbi:HNH endonuclease [Haloflavibacter putidus]|uniref:HNH endonuclease n=1 Tax=Haloflavibacter putidus TaxID=2576776 RepID=A0A507ZM13_9FLAO|nr:HNH endonuclease [Haloflavibacter putidus]TQD37721.1 HNH endonuclease [Haloflavibacter putidus]